MLPGCSYAYGEGRYAEVFGNNPNGELPWRQLKIAKRLGQLAKSKGIPLIGIYVGGRDRLLSKFDKEFDAHLAAFYPGPYGGPALSQVQHCV